MDNELVSIIVPVYNIMKIKKIFNKMINSLLNQSYKNLEIILINDGSKDNTSLYLDSLKRKDKRVKVFSKINEGVESARREGLRVAHGKYIMHIDQDDIYSKDAVEIMHRRICQDKSDVVIANSCRLLGNIRYRGNKNIPIRMKKSKILEHEDFMKSYYHSFFGINNIPVNIWNKMYRKSFLESIPIPPLTKLIIEDLSYNMHILPYARRISIENSITYFYRWGDGRQCMIIHYLIQQYMDIILKYLK